MRAGGGGNALHLETLACPEISGAHDKAWGEFRNMNWSLGANAVLLVAGLALFCVFFAVAKELGGLRPPAACDLVSHSISLKTSFCFRQGCLGPAQPKPKA